MRTYVLRHGKTVLIRNRFGGEHRNMVHLWTAFNGATIRSVFDPIADRRYDRWFGGIRRSRKLNHVVKREEQQELVEACPGAAVCNCDEFRVDVQVHDALPADPPRHIYGAPGLELEDDGAVLTFASFGGGDEREPAQTRGNKDSRAFRRTPRQNYLFGARVLACY